MLRALSAFAVIVLASTLAAADATKLEGTWKLVKSENPLPPGATAHLVFIKDGKLAIKIDVGGQKLELEGTWKMDGDKLVTMQKTPDGKEQKESHTIKKLDDTDLITVDEKGKTDEFKKAK